MSQCLTVYFNAWRPRWHRQHFADDMFHRIFFNEDVWISIKISLKFGPKCPINNISALVQIMAWRPPGDKLLSEPMMVSLPTHICVTRAQWVKFIWMSVVPFYMCWPDGVIQDNQIIPTKCHRTSSVKNTENYMLLRRKLNLCWSYGSMDILSPSFYLLNKLLILTSYHRVQGTEEELGKYIFLIIHVVIYVCISVYLGVYIRNNNVCAWLSHQRNYELEGNNSKR